MSPLQRRRRSRTMLPGLLLGLAALLFAGLAAGGKSVGPSARTAPSNHDQQAVFLDLLAGDGGEAPDIFITTVTSTAGGVIRFEVTLVNRDALGPNDFLGIFVDADADETTGFAEGFEYSLQWTGEDVGLGSWDGSTYARTEAVVNGSWEGSSQVIELASADLGNPKTINFFVWTFLRDDPDVADTSPDGIASWDYVLRAPHVERVRPQLSPSRARAGTRFRVGVISLDLDSGESVRPTKFTCRATLGGKHLRGTGAGRCSFALPKAAKGKPLRILLTAHYYGHAKTVTAYASRVR